MGIASLRPTEDLGGFVNGVDGALYNSKNQGRNRITIAA
jgi:PleD family two-component response regulator